jgi:hypothetical protein
MLIWVSKVCDVVQTDIFGCLSFIILFLIILVLFTGTVFSVLRKSILNTDMQMF